jgi:hypothetical protein
MCKFYSVVVESGGNSNWEWEALVKACAKQKSVAAVPLVLQKLKAIKSLLS